MNGYVLAICHQCKLTHYAPINTDSARDFFNRHHNHHTELVDDPKRKIFRLRDIFGDEVFRQIKGAIFGYGNGIGYAAYNGNADVKEAFGTATTWTTTNAGIGSSATAGWVSNGRDNSSNKYLDALVNIVLASAAWTADKAIYYFTAGLVDSSGSAYTGGGGATPPSGTEGTHTFPDITTHAIGMPLLGVIPTPVTNFALNGGPWGVARCFGGILPPKYLIACINQGGATLGVTAYGLIEVYNTVI